MKAVLSVNSARLILLAGILSIAVCCTANATLIVTDNFNDNATSPSLWSLGIVGVGPSIQERNGRLEFVIPGNSQPGPTGMGAYYMTKGLYGGDFDARVDFQLVNWPPANGVRVGLSIGTWQNVERDSVVYAGDGRNAYVMSLWPGLAIRDTTDQSGTLRMVRSGSTITGYFWDTSLEDWSQIASSVYPAGDKYFVLAVWSDESLFADKDVASPWTTSLSTTLKTVPRRRRKRIALPEGFGAAAGKSPRSPSGELVCGRRAGDQARRKIDVLDRHVRARIFPNRLVEAISL